VTRRGAFRNAGSWMNLTIVGIQFPICIVLGYLWGRWMDSLFGTAPYLMVIFSVFGIIAGFRNLFWIVGEAEKIEASQAAENQQPDDAPENGPGNGPGNGTKDGSGNPRST